MAIDPAAQKNLEAIEVCLNHPEYVLTLKDGVLVAAKNQGLRTMDYAFVTGGRKGPSCDLQIDASRKEEIIKVAQNTLARIERPRSSADNTLVGRVFTLMQQKANEENASSEAAATRSSASHKAPSITPKFDESEVQNYQKQLQQLDKLTKVAASRAQKKDLFPDMSPLAEILTQLRSPPQRLQPLFKMVADAEKQWESVHRDLKVKAENAKNAFKLEEQRRSCLENLKSPEAFNIAQQVNLAAHNEIIDAAQAVPMGEKPYWVDENTRMLDETRTLLENTKRELSTLLKSTCSKLQDAAASLPLKTDPKSLMFAWEGTELIRKKTGTGHTPPKIAINDSCFIYCEPKSVEALQDLVHCLTDPSLPATFLASERRALLDVLQSAAIPSKK